MERSKVSILIKKSSLIFDKYVNQLLVPYRLSGSQFRILMMLYKSPDCSVRQTDIEAAFSMTNPTVTGLVHNLEKNGLVKKVANPEDKRSRFLALTEYADSIEKEMTDGLSETETAVLSELLLKVIKRHKEK